jgi:hypothetical protein
VLNKSSGISTNACVPAAPAHHSNLLVSNKRQNQPRRTSRAKTITPARQEALRPLEQGLNLDSKLKHYMNLAEIALKNTTARKTKPS